MCPLMQIFFWVWTLFEVVVVVTSSMETSSIHIVPALAACSHPALTASKIRITPLFLVGWFFALSGGLIRFACYRALGSLFTFELSIRKNHRLITSGPYAVVRHPSYTGLVMAILGYSLCHLSGGSWLRECSGLSLDGTVGRALISVWAIGGIFAVSVLAARTSKEDAMLKSEFSDWDQWARRVPWKLIPFIY
jgi:protein-S-isoprenylcysteine O-methyltransferase Ste14